ncbi:hypothetical protein [Neobacillus drentensis]|uniref:hypothetical protein n=1 Tax=Neobacillus drentensis TaxID=220684 RepID=UPI0030005F40
MEQETDITDSTDQDSDTPGPSFIMSTQSQFFFIIQIGPPYMNDFHHWTAVAKFSQNRNTIKKAASFRRPLLSKNTSTITHFSIALKEL